MNTNFILYGAIALFIVGIIMLATSNKNRLATGDWSNTLQWGYLLMMIGVFGMLSAGLAWSFTAVLLLFTAFTGAIWLWQKLSHKDKIKPDNNHLRDNGEKARHVVAQMVAVGQGFRLPFAA